MKKAQVRGATAPPGPSSFDDPVVVRAISVRSADRNHHARVAVVRIRTAPLVLVDEVAEAVGDLPVGLPVACW
jgi:hypothetical protein